MSPMVRSGPLRGQRRGHDGPDPWICAHPVSAMTGSATQCSGCRLGGIGTGFKRGSAGSACPDLRLAASTVHRDQVYGLRLVAAAVEQGGAEMTEPGAVLEAVQTAIADLAAVLVAVRAGLGGN